MKFSSMKETMPEKPNYKFIIDKSSEVLMNLDNGVFIPTGTTRSLIEAVIGYVRKPGKLLDIGSGSGVIGLSLFQIGLVKEPLYASDLSEQAIACMKRNAVLHNLHIIAKKGSLFEPWENEKFDYIVNDVSGVAEEVAKISPWFNNVPCQSGPDGTLLVVEALRKAPTHLNSNGLFFFPIVSFSNVNKILTVARTTFTHVKQLSHTEWPLPEEMYQHILTLNRLKEEGHIRFLEKFGMVLWYTDIYVAYNDL